MGLLGKKYPASVELFKKSGLSGEWDSTKAGQRMKLPTPETWETALSATGNKHTTWEALIDHKKLPFMAMLRNLRNIIITGVSSAHHEVIITRLTDEKSIASSRQLPWRFLSAYEAINIDLEKLMNDILDHDGSTHKIIEVNFKGKKGSAQGKKRTIKKRVIIPVNMPDLPLISRYRESIDTAIRLSVLHNLKPISGSTVVFVDVSGSMQCPCSSKGNMGSIQQVIDIAILLGLMLNDICEDCDYRIFSSPGSEKTNHLPIKLKENTILENIKIVHKECTKLGGGTDFPFEYFESLMAKKKIINNFIILSDMMIAPGKQEMAQRGRTVSGIVKEYREKVNKDLLFIGVDLYGQGKSIVDVNSGNHNNDVLITGFSDHILRFIAERGNLKQLEHVKNIDKIKKLGPKGKLPRAPKPIPKGTSEKGKEKLDNSLLVGDDEKMEVDELVD